MLHYIITRFNLRLWTHDKKGNAIDRDEWLERRLNLFEQYCLPSICKQTSKNFTWFLLFDSETPVKYKERIKNYQNQCPQIRLISVNPSYSLQFINIIQDVVKDFAKEHMKAHPEEETLITTYLDNDDALRWDFVEQIQKCAEAEHPKTFISFVNGIQYFTELKFATRIRYKNNHFISYIEDLTYLSAIKTVYGFGSHFFIDQIKGSRKKYLNTVPMWVEVVHKENVDNDVKMTWHTKPITDIKQLNVFGDNITICKNSRSIYYTKFTWRRIKQMVRRARNIITGKKW